MALWRIRATVDDRPGYLSVLTASLALRSVNILAVQVHTTEAGAVDDFLVDTPDTMSEPACTSTLAALIPPSSNLNTVLAGLNGSITCPSVRLVQNTVD